MRLTERQMGSQERDWAHPMSKERREHGERVEKEALLAQTVLEFMADVCTRSPLAVLVAVGENSVTRLK